MRCAGRRGRCSEVYSQPVNALLKRWVELYYSCCSTFKVCRLKLHLTSIWLSEFTVLKFDIVLETLHKLILALHQFFNLNKILLMKNLPKTVYILYPLLISITTTEDLYLSLLKAKMLQLYVICLLFYENSNSNFSSKRLNWGAY